MESRRDESIRLLAHSLERVDENRAFDVRVENPRLAVMLQPGRDYMAEAERLYDAELDKLVMERCEAVIDGLWKKPGPGPWVCGFCRLTYTLDKPCCERQRSSVRPRTPRPRRCASSTLQANIPRS